MTTKVVECLNCGAARRVATDPAHGVHPGECGRCGYVGWADSETITEALRRTLREHAPQQRRAAAW